MSRISYKLSDLGDTEFFDKLDAFISAISNCGNDRLEIICDLEVSQPINKMIIKLHKTSENESVAFYY